MCSLSLFNLYVSLALLAEARHPVADELMAAGPAHSLDGECEGEMAEELALRYL